MASTDKELEQHLMEAGIRLSQLPSSVDELLPLLDRVENFLSRVEQSPPKTMLDALYPSMKVLVQDMFLRHSDVDVQVAVASCISEITRITAPDAPYDDDKMKDVFQVIVSSFQNFSDKSSPSYNKRTTILETVAKVRSCVVMLDLECDGLIFEMFQHFLKEIRDYHPANVIMSMETIMTLVLEESEDIPLELLIPILASVKRDNEDFPAIARKLGERVFENCAVKLRPYLTQVVESLELSLDDYSKVVASICKDTTGAVLHNDDNVERSKLAKVSLVGAAQVAKENVTKQACPEEVKLDNVRSPKSVMSNGIAETVNEETSERPGSFEKPEDGHVTNESGDVNLTSKVDNVDSDSVKSVKSESRPEQTVQRRGRKVKSPLNSIEPSDFSRIDSEKETENKMPDPQIDHVNHTHTSPGEDQRADTGLPSGNVKAIAIKISSPKASERDDAATVTSPSTRESLPGESPSNKAGRPKNKERLILEGSPSVGLASTKASDGTSDLEIKLQRLPDGSRNNKARRPKRKGSLIKEDAPPVDLASTKASDGTKDSEVKKQRGSGKKTAAHINEEKNLTGGVASKTEGETTSETKTKPLRQSAKKGDASDLEAMPLKQSGKKWGSSKPKLKPLNQSSKKGHACISEIKSLVQLGKKEDTSRNNEDRNSSKKDESKRQRHLKDTIENDGPKFNLKDESKEIISSSKSPKSIKDESHLDEETKTISKRKCTPGKDKLSEKMEYGDNLIGSKVKVWWPQDKEFYVGIIDSFDPVEKKHKVLYTDGDEEILYFPKEKWEFVKDKTVQEEAAEDLSPVTSAKMHKKEKVKTNSELEKMEISPKRGGVVTSGKSKGSATNPSGKADDVTLKTTNAKGNTARSGKKASYSGTGKGKSGFSDDGNGNTPDPVKGKSPDKSKTQESGSKSEKKRKREQKG